MIDLIWKWDVRRERSAAVAVSGWAERKSRFGRRVEELVRALTVVPTSRKLRMFSNLAGDVMVQA